MMRAEDFLTQSSVQSADAFLSGRAISADDFLSKDENPLLDVPLIDEGQIPSVDVFGSSSLTKDIAHTTRAMAETGAGIATGMIAFPVSKLRGLWELAISSGDAEAAKAAEEAWARTIQFEPTTKEAQGAMQTIDMAISPIFKTLKQMGETVVGEDSPEWLKYIGGVGGELGGALLMGKAGKAVKGEIGTFGKRPAIETKPAEILPEVKPVEVVPEIKPAAEIVAEKPAADTFLDTKAETPAPEIVQPGATSGVLPSKGRLVVPFETVKSEAAYEKPPGIESRSTMIKSLEEVLDIPIRQGRFRTKAMGIFKPREEVIRVKNPNDFETATHEAGHYLQKLMEMPKQMPPEIKALAYEGAKSINKEGFAEFVRLYTTQPELAQQKAPAFFNTFEAKLKTMPDIQDALLRTRQAWENWLAAPDVEKIQSTIKYGSDVKQASPTLNDVYRAVVDELNPLKEAKKIVEAAKGGKLRPQDDFFTLAWLTRGWARKAEQYLKWGTFQHDAAQGVKFTGKAFEEIVKPIEKAGHMQILDAYLLAKRASNDPRLIEKYKHQLPEEVLRNGAADIEARYPAIKQAADELYKYNDQLLDYLVDSGRIAQETANAVRQKNLFYAPFYRVLDSQSSPSGLAKNRFANLTNPVKKLSQKAAGDIYSPVENILYNTYAIINAAERNRIGAAIIKAEKEVPGIGGLVERLPVDMKPFTVKPEEMAAHFKRMGQDAGIDFDEFGIDPKDIGSLTAWRPNYTPKPGEVIFYDKGTPKVYQLAPDLYEAITKVNTDTLDMATKIASLPAKWLRVGATLSPEFVGRNPFRDQMTAFVFSKYGYRPFVDLVGGIAHMAKQDATWQRFNASGAAHAALVSLDRNYLTKNLREMLDRKKVSTIVKNPVKVLQILSELTEEGTRVGEFARAQKKEGQSFDALLKSGIAGRDVTLDFARIGAKTKSMNAITAFWNAQVQGVDKMIREFKENPTKTYSKAVIGITVPSVLLWAAQKDDPHYQELPTWRKIMCWNIVTHKEDGSLNHVWSIPKPFELGLLFGSFPEMMLDYWKEKDPKAVEELAAQIIQGVSPGFIPTGLLPVVEIMGGKSFFFDRPIVSRSKEDLEPVLQYGPHTSETVRLLAEGMNKVPYLKKIASPDKIQHLILGYTAGLGRVALEQTDKIVRELGVLDVKPDPSMTLSDIPGIRAFVARFPSSSSRSIEQFYDRYTEMKTKFESAKEKAGVRGIGLQIPQPDTLRQYEQTAKALSVLRKAVDLTWRSKTMTPEKKRETMDRIYMNMINVSRNALGKGLIGNGRLVSP